MSGGAWRVEDPERTVPAGLGTFSSLVSLHFLRAALRRRWREAAAFAVLGLLLAGTFLVLVPAEPKASMTLLLAHDPQDDPAMAMATDVSLLSTRSVTENTLARLGLDTEPEDFEKQVEIVEVSTSLLEVTLAAPTRDEAVRTLDVLGAEFLEFRNAQLKTRTDAVISQNRARITELTETTDQLSDDYDAALAQGRAEQASQILGERAEAAAQIASLEEQVQDAGLRTNSIAVASHVVDEAALVPSRLARRTVLGLASGLIGGTAAGLGWVFVTAVLSHHLRRRAEIASALGAPVRLSAGRIGRRTLWRPRRRTRHLELLAAGLTSALPSPRTGTAWLALACVDAVADGARILQQAGRDAAARGEKVVLVDLTGSGALTWLALRGPDEVYRPEGNVALVRGPLNGAEEAPEPWAERLAEADLVLSLGEVDLDTGTGALAGWARSCVVLVRAGGASAEFLDTTARMLADTGVDIEYAMVVGADRTDESAGIGPEQAR